MVTQACFTVLFTVGKTQWEGGDLETGLERAMHSLPLALKCLNVYAMNATNILLK